MKNVVIIVIGLIGFCSCENSKIVIDGKEGENKVIRYYPNKEDSLNYRREFYYSNGQLGTVGEYKNGKMNGPWTWWFANGIKSDEAYLIEDLYINERKHWYPNGNLKLIELIEKPCSGTCCDGLNIYYDSLGIIAEKVKMLDGEIHDTLYYYWENGSVFKLSLYENGKRNGFYNEFHKNGNKWVVGQYHNDIMNGRWEWYDTLGHLDKVENYLNGIFIKEE